MSRNALMTIACVLLAGAACLAVTKRVVLKDGRVIKGELVEKTKDGIKIKVKLGVLFFANDKVKSIEDVHDAGTDYADRLAKIKKGDADAHVELGRWAMDRKLYEKAVEQFKAALAIKPKHERATLLLRQAEAKLKQASEAPDGTAAGTGAEGDGGTDRLPFEPKLLLRQDDIYRIRLEELGEKERIVVEFRNDVVKKFIEKMRGVGDFKDKGFQRKFRSRPRPVQAKYMLDKTDRDDPLKDDIIIKNDPNFMREFRTRVWRLVSGSCGASQCHGAKTGQKKLKLFNFTGRSDNVDYTNFLILDSYHTKAGLFMINRDSPDQSLLLQYGLPRNQAQFRHHKEIKPTFASRKAAQYQQALDWIKGLAGPIHPNYRTQHLPPDVMKRPVGLEGLRLPSAKPKPGAEKEKEKETPF